MELNALTAISPVDGRYLSKTEHLSPYFSEYGLIKYRVHVEIEYFIMLTEIPLPQLEGFPKGQNDKLREIVETFSLEDAEAIKAIEKTTNHDVKAVEYFLKEKFDMLSLRDYKEFIHFGLTSQDINNTAIPLQLRKSLEEVYYPSLETFLDLLMGRIREWKDVSMLAKTHGQPASPTNLGKELLVFHKRVQTQLQTLKSIQVPAKFGGATGNFNAHHIAYPAIDWHAFANRFVDEKLGLNRSHPTTQIEHYDQLAAIFDALRRINTILIDFSRDIWQYISMNYFKQKIKEGEVGSSAMPHKVNPIDFENAEGNLGIANANFDFLSGKLPISRLQRDLTDSTVLRHIGVPIAHTMIAMNSLEKGIKKLELNKAAIDQELEDNWTVVAEAIQTVLRREGYPKPYEALKGLTRKNTKITPAIISEFIEELDLSADVKAELKSITPQNYTGIIPEELR